MQHLALVNAIQSALRTIHADDGRVRVAFARAGHLFCPSGFVVEEESSCDLLDVNFGYVGFNAQELSICPVAVLRGLLESELLALAGGQRETARRSRQRYFNRNLWAADMVKVQAYILG